MIRAFTLLETLLYLALFSLLLTGVLASAYTIATTSERAHAEATLEAEGWFIMRSLLWEAQDASVIEPQNGVTSEEIILRAKDGDVLRYGLESQVLIRTSASERQALSAYPVKHFSAHRDGFPGDTFDPEYILVRITLSSPGHGAPSRTFEDTLYFTAP